MNLPREDIRIFFMFRLCLSKFILACTDAGDDSTIDEQIGACDKTGMLSLPHKDVHMILANELLYLSSVMLRVNQIASVGLFHC